MKTSTKQRFESGFTLVEILPAIYLLTVISIVAMKSLVVDFRIQQRILQQQLLEESFKRIAVELLENDSFFLCELTDDEDWQVVELPDETWLPETTFEGSAIAWKISKSEDGQTAFRRIKYRRRGMSDWKHWISLVQ